MVWSTTRKSDSLEDTTSTKLRRSTRSHTLSQILGSLVLLDEYKQAPEVNFRPLHQGSERDSYEKKQSIFTRI